MTDVQRIAPLPRRATALGAVALLTLFTACSPQAVDQSDELSAQTDRWETAFDAGDLDGLAAIYAEDCRLMPPNEQMATGRSAAKESFRGMIEAGLTGNLDTIAVAAAGDLGHHVGTYEIATPDGATVDRGKFVETWRKSNGTWMLVNDIWNSSRPMGAGTTTVVATHRVRDVEHWLAAWSGDESRETTFKQHGVESVSVLRGQPDSDIVGLVIQVSDMDAFDAFMSSPDAQQAKAADGVIDSTLVVLTESGM